MSKNSDLDRLRNVMKFPQSAPSKALVLRLAQELEETRARHRKAWGRAEAAEAAIQRVREVMSDWETDEDAKGLPFDLERALDGGEQG